MNPMSVYERRGHVQILDVREHGEFAAGRIEGALHVPAADLPARTGQLDHNRPIVTVCRSGRRSQQAADYLNKSGFAAENMDGGMKRWVREGLPVLTPNGQPGHVA